jgi:hypothetical protein
VEVLFKDDISHAEKLRIAEEWDLDHARARILEDQGRHVEAAEVHLTNGDTSIMGFCSILLMQ